GSQTPCARPDRLPCARPEPRCWPHHRRRINVSRMTSRYSLILPTYSILRRNGVRFQWIGERSSTDMEHDFTPMRAIAMFEKVDALPGAKQQLATSNRDG